ncbi:MAG: DUF4440 domain-containing protein [Deltaproteobacteria bacterium]|nr:DUF4440 domain-containing protein [Deltaproteobacteria bacterium]
MGQLTASDDAAVRAVLETQREAWNRGDLDAFMAGYARADELTFTSGGHIQRGFAATQARYRERYGDGAAGMGQLDFELLAVQGVGADGAVVLGRWRLTGTASAGGGVFSVVLERQAAGWRVIHDHTSVQGEAPP